MPAATLESLIAKETETVQKEREDLLAKRAEIDQQLTALDRRLDAATNYRLTLEGKFTPPEQASRKTRAPSSAARAPRGSREQIKAHILELLSQHPDGLLANQITDALPNFSKQIPNVLSLLKSEGKITQKDRRTPYHLPSQAA